MLIKKGSKISIVISKNAMEVTDETFAALEKENNKLKDYPDNEIIYSHESEEEKILGIYEY